MKFFACVMLVIALCCFAVDVQAQCSSGGGCSSGGSSGGFGSGFLAQPTFAFRSIQRPVQVQVVRTMQPVLQVQPAARQIVGRPEIIAQSRSGSGVRWSVASGRIANRSMPISSRDVMMVAKLPDRTWSSDLLPSLDEPFIPSSLAIAQHTR